MKPRFSFLRQLLLLTLGSVAAVSGLTLASLRWSTFPAFMGEFRKELSAEPFMTARRQRLADLGHMAHILALDVQLNRFMRSPSPRAYLDQVAQLSPELLRQPQAKQKQQLNLAREQNLFQLKELGERLFLSRDDATQTVDCFADLCLVVEVHGVILLELSSDPGLGVRRYRSASDRYPEPGQLLFNGDPFAEEAFSNLDRESNRPVAGCFAYGTGFYQGVALDLPLGTGLVVLADRVDDRLASVAAQSCGQSSQAFVVNARSHRLVASSRAELKAAVSQRTWSLGEGEARLAGTDWQSVTRPLQQGRRSDLQLVLLKPTDVLYRVVQNQWQLLALIVTAVTLAIWVVAGTLAASMGKPIQRLAWGLGQVGRGDLDVHLEPRGPGEVRQAAEAFNRMVSDLKEKGTLEKFVARLDELRHQADLSDEHVRLQTQFGRFVVVARLGEGGMATVYKALPVETLDEKDKVAIKVIHRQFAQDPDFQARLQREFEVLRSLSHPGIVRVLEWGELNGILYLAMEFVAGTLLSQHLKNGPFSLSEFKQVSQQILEAVGYAHESGVIHRDLKPDNIMLTATGIKIMDFGLATGSEFAHLTATGVALGTPAYIAPEQVTGAPLDSRADQYALGIVFFEMLAGQAPFQASDAMALLQLQLSAQPPEPDLYRSDIPPAWSTIILKMLEKSPEQRFPDLKAATAAWLSAW
ncbi:MAG: protein kinase [Vulcanimicrobiota bacterium]